MSALSAEGLTARYPGQLASRPALVEVDLEVEPGQRLLLIGPNGAGKSTFIRVFAGLMHAAHGKALITGRPAREVRNLVGVVSHATYLYDELTAAENLRFYGQLYCVPEPAERSAVWPGPHTPSPTTDGRRLRRWRPRRSPRPGRGGG